MKKTRGYVRVAMAFGLLMPVVAGFTGGQAAAFADPSAENHALPSVSWQEQAVAYARILSQVQWTPVAEGMPRQWRVTFQKGAVYMGVPYSNQTYQGRTLGRSIGFEIFLKTFLAAVENM